MKWVSTPPTKPGWYWRRTRFGDCEAPHRWCKTQPSLVSLEFSDTCITPILLPMPDNRVKLDQNHWVDGWCRGCLPYPPTRACVEEWSDEPIAMPEDKP